MHPVNIGFHANNQRICVLYTKGLANKDTRIVLVKKCDRILMIRGLVVCFDFQEICHESYLMLFDHIKWPLFWSNAKRITDLFRHRGNNLRNSISSWEIKWSDTFDDAQCFVAILSVRSFPSKVQKSHWDFSELINRFSVYQGTFFEPTVLVNNLWRKLLLPISRALFAIRLRNHF